MCVPALCVALFCVVQALLTASMQRLHTMTLPELTAVIRGLAKLQCQPSNAWLHTFYSALSRQMGTTGTTTESETVTADSEQGFLAEAAPAAGTAAAAAPAAAAQPSSGTQQGGILHHAAAADTAQPPPAQPPAAAAAAAAQAGQQRRQQAVPASCVVGCLWGLQGLACSPPAPLIQAMLDRVSLTHTAPDVLASLVHVLAKLRYLPPQQWVNQLFDVTLPQLVVTRSALGHTPPMCDQSVVSHAASGSDAAQQAADSVTQAGLSDTDASSAEGAASSGHIQAGDSLSGAVAVEQTQHAGQSRSQVMWGCLDCIKVLWGFSRLGVRLPEPWLAACEVCVLMQLRQTQPRELVMLLQGLRAQRAAAQPPKQRSRVVRMPGLIMPVLRGKGGRGAMRVSAPKATSTTATQGQENSTARLHSLLTDAILARVSVLHNTPAVSCLLCPYPCTGMDVALCTPCPA